MLYRYSVSLCVAGLFALAPITGSAAPDDLCVKQAQGVPGPQNKFPEWWVPAAPGKPQRWTGSTVRRGNPATAAVSPDMASIRSVWDAGSRRLFLHLQVEGDPQLNPEQDMAAFALTDDAGNPLLYIDVRPLLGCRTDGTTNDTTNIGDISGGCQSGEAVSGGTPVNPVVRYAAASGGSWGGISGTNPTTVGGAAFPILDENHWVEVEEDSGTFNWDFKMSLQLPVDGGTGQVDPNVRLYATNFVAFKSGPGALDPVHTFQFPLLCNPSSTIGTCEMNHGSAGPTLPTAVPTTVSEWPALQTGTTGDCAGIELMRELVGSEEGAVTDVVPGTAVPYELPGRTINAVTGSSLWAGFHNDTADALTSGSLTAEFRIANWGLTYANWDSATWDLVATQALAGAVNPGDYAGQVSGAGSLKTPPYTMGSVPTNSHQCMHVRLTGTPGSGDTLNFKTDSVYRNMDFVNASVVQRPADVNLIGRPLGPGQANHPVYLVVRTHNMPSPDMCEELNGDLEGCQPVNLDNAAPGAVWNQLPRYSVHGFVDSGRRVNLPNAPQTPILSPFSSYGYYVRHEGDLQGWEHRLDGATPIAPYDNVYRLDVQDGHIATVVNTIRAIDSETPSCNAITPPVVEPPVVEPPGGGIDPGGGVVEGGGGPPGPVVPPASSAPLGCEPVQVRPQCTPDSCEPHDACTYIEGSEFPYEGTAPPSEGPPTTEPGGTCCLQSNQTPEQEAGGAAGASCLFVLILGLRRRRRRR